MPVNGTVRQALVNFIAASERGVTLPDIREELYGDLASTLGDNTVHMHIYLANKDLARMGYRIYCHGGQGAKGSRYYLGRIDSGPDGQPPA